MYIYIYMYVYMYIPQSRCRHAQDLTEVDLVRPASAGGAAGNPLGVCYNILYYTIL